MPPIQVMNPLGHNLPRLANFFLKRSVAWRQSVENPGLGKTHVQKCRHRKVRTLCKTFWDVLGLNMTECSECLGYCEGKNWCEQIEEALKVLSDGKGRKSIKPEADNFKDYEQKSMFPSLYRWKISTLELVQHKGAEAETRFLRLLFLSANTLQLPMWAGEGHELKTMQRWEELYLKLLKDRRVSTIVRPSVCPNPQR